MLMSKKDHMTDFVKPVAEWCAALIELIGIATITGFALSALAYSIFALMKGKDRSELIQDLRQRIGRGLLLGLEFLLAADIIITVAVELTFSSVGTLALIVLIRTFLSFTLEVELDGRWPWQKKE